MLGTIAAIALLVGFFGLVAYVTIPALAQGISDATPDAVKRWLRS